MSEAEELKWLREKLEEAQKKISELEKENLLLKDEVHDLRSLTGTHL